MKCNQCGILDVETIKKWVPGIMPETYCYVDLCKKCYDISVFAAWMTYKAKKLFGGKIVNILE